MAKKPVRPTKRIGAPPAKEPEELIDDLTESSKAAAIKKNLIDLSKEEAKEMSAWVKARVDDAKGSKVWQETKERILRLREEYEHGVGRTDTGIKGAHDYRTHIASSQADGMASRILSIFSTDPLLKFEGRNEMGLKNARGVEMFVDYHHDVNAKLAWKADEISSTLTIEGHCVLYTPWVLEIEKDKPVMVQKQLFSDGTGKTSKIDVEDKAALDRAQAAGAIPKTPISYIVEEEKRTLVAKNFPDLRVFSLLDYLCPQDGKPGMDKLPAWEAVRLPYTMDDLEKMDEAGEIYPGVLKEIKNFLRKKPIEAEKPRAGSRGADSVSSGSDEPLDNEALDAVLYFWTIWGKQKSPGKKGLQDLITLYHEDSGWVIQTRMNTNIDSAPPMFHLRLLMAPWRMAGIGIMEMASPGERAINDISNYILDIGKIMACLPFKYNKKKFPDGFSPFQLMKGIGVINNQDFVELNFPDRRPMDINVASFIRGNTERRTGQGDLQLGRESDVTGKTPPTARGIISILREGQVRYTKANFGIINELVRMGQFEVKLFQQYLASETPVEILGEDGKDIFPQGVSRHQILGSYYVTANMAAQQMARELDAELNMLLYDKLKDNPFIAKSLSSFNDMTVDVLHSLGKRKTWLKPLSFYQKAAGQQGGEAPGGLNPQEQQFVQELLQAGVPPEIAKQKLEEMRSGVHPADQMAGQDAEHQLLTAQGGGAA